MPLPSPRTHALALAVAVLALGCNSAHVRGAGMQQLTEPSPNAYVEALVTRALGLSLDHHRQWLRLGHYREGDFGGSPMSEADGPYFFLSPDGKRDPRAELVATIRGMFLAPMQEPAEGEAVPARHPMCRFPARLAFLVRELGIDPRRLPAQRCPRFGTFLQEINPRSATLIFSSYYLNNPASAFGHTFLRFDKAQTDAIGERRELLDYAVDFSADVDTGNAVIYAFKGLLGAFPGTAKRLPYYYKVREYADYESRDIWEYELELTPEQLFMLVAHVWEIGSTYFDYWYIDENCSYRIHMMLEAARPDIELMRHLTSPVLPADTVKALYENPGLVRKVTYRPSLRTKFMRSTEGLDGDQLDAVEALAEDADHPLPGGWDDRARARVLDAAADLVDMRHVKDLVHKRDSAAAELKRAILARRARLRVTSDAEETRTPWQEQPQKGHGSKRLGLAAGTRDLDAGFVALDFRLAMHDLADPPDGYPELAQLEFLPTRLRLWPTRDRLRITLDELDLVRIVSLTSMSRFDLGLSWRVSTGARTLENAGCDLCTAGFVRVGGGPAKSFADDALVVFATADSVVQVGDGLEGIEGRGVRAGFGPTAGIRVRFDRRLVWLTTGEWIFYPTQRDDSLWQADSVLRWSYAEDQALSLELRALQDAAEAQLFVLSYL